MIQHHKKLSLDMDKLLPFGGIQPAEENHTAASSAVHGKPRGNMKSRLKVLGSTGELEERQLSGRSDETVGVKTQKFSVNGKAAKVSLTAEGLTWSYSRSRECCLSVQANDTVYFQDCVTVQQLVSGWKDSLRFAEEKVYRFMIYTFKRNPHERCVWAPRRIIFESPNQEAVREYIAGVSSGIAQYAFGRPSNLLVIMNPNSGSGRARAVFHRIVAPVFVAGNIKSTVCETEYAGHAQKIVEELQLSTVQNIDGIVAVGGDGIFHEVFNGLLQARAAADPELQSRLMQLRVAHIPAGSTDAVACTLHGTRSVFTAAMHIALGDRTELDILRVDTREGSTRFASCIAAYGFMGDVMMASESYRWLGSLRYDLVGAAKLLSNNVYQAKVSYLQGAGSHAITGHYVCSTNCPVCRAASFVKRTSPVEPALHPFVNAPNVLSNAMQAADHPPLLERIQTSELSSSQTPREVPVIQEEWCAHSARKDIRTAQRSSSNNDKYRPPVVLSNPNDSRGFLQPAASARERHVGEWKAIDGEFVSIMLIVMPCLSEKTRQGMARFGHLADGRLKLVLVKRCNILQYVQFLLSMSRTGVFPGQHSYVEVIDAVAVKVECEGRLSSWNLDGELLSSRCLTAEVHQGLLEVFARGVER